MLADETIREKIRDEVYILSISKSKLATRKKVAFLLYREFLVCGCIITVIDYMWDNLLNTGFSFY